MYCNHKKIIFRVSTLRSWFLDYQPFFFPFFLCRCFFLSFFGRSLLYNSVLLLFVPFFQILFLIITIFSLPLFLCSILFFVPNSVAISLNLLAPFSAYVYYLFIFQSFSVFLFYHFSFNHLFSCFSISYCSVSLSFFL